MLPYSPQGFSFPFAFSPAVLLILFFSKKILCSLLPLNPIYPIYDCESCLLQEDFLDWSLAVPSPCSLNSSWIFDHTTETLIFIELIVSFISCVSSVQFLPNITGSTWRAEINLSLTQGYSLEHGWGSRHGHRKPESWCCHFLPVGTWRDYFSWLLDFLLQA